MYTILGSGLSGISASYHIGHENWGISIPIGKVISFGIRGRTFLLHAMNM